MGNAVRLRVGLLRFTWNYEFKILEESPFPIILGLDFLTHPDVSGFVRYAVQICFCSRDGRLPLPEIEPGAVRFYLAAHVDRLGRLPRHGAT